MFAMDARLVQWVPNLGGKCVTWWTVEQSGKEVKKAILSASFVKTKILLAEIYVN